MFFFSFWVFRASNFRFRCSLGPSQLASGYAPILLATVRIPAFPVFGRERTQVLMVLVQHNPCVGSCAYGFSVVTQKKGHPFSFPAINQKELVLIYF
jgi:hypothetical protein